jgi:hypothetical protein
MKPNMKKIFPTASRALTTIDASELSTWNVLGSTRRNPLGCALVWGGLDQLKYPASLACSILALTSWGLSHVHLNRSHPAL